MTKLLAALLAWTAANSSYEPPARPPTVEYRSARFFLETCPGEVHCSTRGYYEDGTGTIVLHESHQHRDDVRARSILVHEIVHYLQNVSGRWGEKTCESWVAREHEAFRLQMLYIASRTGNLSIFMPPLSTELCKGAGTG